MDVVSALLLRDAFAREAFRELIRERFPGISEEDMVEIFSRAMQQGHADWERHLPNVAGGDVQEVLNNISVSKPEYKRF